MLESEVVYGLQLVGRQHDLQPLFPRQADSALAVHHEKNIIQSGKLGKLGKLCKLGKLYQYVTYSFVSILLHGSGGQRLESGNSVENAPHYEGTRPVLAAPSAIGSIKRPNAGLGYQGSRQQGCGMGPSGDG
jgi:hypothetical protein